MSEDDRASPPEGEATQSQNDSRWSAQTRYTLPRWSPSRHLILALVSFAVAAVIGYGLSEPPVGWVWVLWTLLG